MANLCPVNVFLERISEKEVMLQRLADGESISKIAQDFQKSFSHEGARQLVVRCLRLEVLGVLGRILREDGDLYTVPFLESLRAKSHKRRDYVRKNRSKEWWRRRRKDSVFVVVNNRRGAVRIHGRYYLDNIEWYRKHPQDLIRGWVYVEFPDGESGYISSSDISF